MSNMLRGVTLPPILASQTSAIPMSFNVSTLNLIRGLSCLKFFSFMFSVMSTMSWSLHAYVGTRKGPGLSFVNAGLDLLWQKDEVNLVMYLVVGRVPSCSS